MFIRSLMSTPSFAHSDFVLHSCLTMRLPEMVPEVQYVFSRAAGLACVAPTEREACGAPASTLLAAICVLAGGFAASPMETARTIIA